MTANRTNRILALSTLSAMCFVLASCGVAPSGNLRPSPPIPDHAPVTEPDPAPPTEPIVTVNQPPATTTGANDRWAWSDYGIASPPPHGTPSTAPDLTGKPTLDNKAVTLTAKICEQSDRGNCYADPSRNATVTSGSFTFPVAPPAPIADLQGAWITPEVKAAWAEGWTGKGVTIALYDSGEGKKLDYFKEGKEIDGITYNTSSWTSYQNVGHGSLVEMIAGGKRDLTVKYSVESQRNNTPDNLGGGLACNNDNPCRADYSAHGSFKIGPYYGVAPEAELKRFDVISDQSNRPIEGVSLDLRAFDILNMSIGAAYRVKDHADLFWMNSFNHANTQDSASGTLIVKAAGNEGKNAEWGAINNALMKSNYAASTLLVGGVKSETDDTLICMPATRTRPELCPGSNMAGKHKNNFVVDVGVVEIRAGIDDFQILNSVGTSYAAPRVSGKAALLMHKFGGLTAAQYATIIKLTADDLGAPGVDEVYGHGRVNLTRMLSPLGTVR